MGGPERRADDAVEEGLVLFQQGKLDQAMELWREAQSLAPDHTRALEYMTYLESHREALEQRFRLAETQLFGGSSAEPTAPLEDVPSKLRLPDLPQDDNGEEDEDEDEPTVSMPVKVLAQGLAQSRSRRAAGAGEGDYLEVMEGGGGEMVDDFEPMEKTPVGVHIPDPVRLVATDNQDDEDDDGIYEWDDDTPSVREVGLGPAEPAQDLGLVTGSELSLQEDGEEIEELDEADILEEIVDDPGKRDVEVKYRSLAEFDAAYEDEYVDGDVLRATSDRETSAGSDEVMLEVEPEPELDPHVKDTLKLPLDRESEPILELELEPDEGVLELMPPDSGEERELELDLGQSVPGPSELVELTPVPDRAALSGQDEGQDMVALAARDRETPKQPVDRDLLELTPEPDHEEFRELTPPEDVQMEVQVQYSGQPPTPPEDETDFSSVEIDMEDSVDMSPDEVEFGGAMDFDDVGEVEDFYEEEEAEEPEEPGTVSVDSGFSWESGSIDWSGEGGESGLEVLVFERDDPTPTVGEPVLAAISDPILAAPTQQDSYGLEESDGAPMFEMPSDESSEDPLAWAPTEETSGSSHDFQDKGFSVDQQPTPRDPAPQQASASALSTEEPTLQLARDLLKVGELEDALTVCEQVCEADPSDIEATRFLERIQQSLLKRYWAAIGDLSKVPTVKVPHHEILWQDMDHRKGFLLSRIDGMLTYEDIIDISGMADFEVCQILVTLKRDGVIG